MNNHHRVLNSKNDKNLYSIVFDPENETGCNAILSANRRHAELLLLTLGDAANVVIKDRETNPETWDWLYGRTYAEVLSELKWTYKEEQELLELIQHIPLPLDLAQKGIQVSKNDPQPQPIKREVVHKVNQGNVLLSNSYRCGNMLYFNGFTQSSEFNIDHSSDHLEGIQIFEVARQSGIASIHLSGIPLSSVIVVIKAETKYRNYIEKEVPIIVRTIPVAKFGYTYVVYELIQNNKSCSLGCLSGIVYNSAEDYKRGRKPIIRHLQTESRIAEVNS